MEIGISTFGEVTPDARTGELISVEQRMHNLLEEIELADRVGLDEGATFVGTPDEVVAKILWQHEIFGHDRFLIQLTIGSIPHERTLHAIELLGTEVAPRVRAELACRGDR